MQITPITCRGLLHRSQCPSCVKLYDVWHIKPRWNPTGDTESSEPDGSNSAAASQPPTRKRPGATVFYTFTIGGVLLCVRMCHILILPYTHQGGIPPYTPRRHTSFMSIGALVKNKNSSCEDANTGEEEADEGSQERWFFF